jgi:hypothetical protein
MILTMFRIVIWHKWVMAYAEGMSLYRIENWKGRREIISMLRALLSEVYEVFEALIHCQPLEVVAELCDVWHAFLCTISILVFGTWTQSPIIYYFLYMMAPLTAWKHGDRYLSYSCVRSLNNHKGALDHVCVGDSRKIRELMTDLQMIKVDV